MRVLLVNPPIRMSRRPYFPPIGLATIAQVLLDNGHEAEIFDINAHRWHSSEIKEHLPKKKFDLIGVSGLITTYKYMDFIVPMLREAYDSDIVMGGGGYSSMPDAYNERFNPDYGVCGEGEWAMLELAGGEYRKGLADLDELPLPAYHLLDMDAYTPNDRYIDAAIMATRGCPYSCRYCYHIFGRGVRFRGVDKVVEEILLLRDKYGARHFLFGDECMTVRRSFVHDLMKEVAKLDITFEVYARVDAVDADVLEWLRDAGCKLIGFGLESGSQRILDSMDKRVTVEQMRESFLLAKQYIPQVSGTFIVGYPGEDTRSVVDTLNFMKSIDYYRVPFHLSPYPGTPVFEDNKDKILDKFGSWHNFLLRLNDAYDFVINLTDWTDDEYFKVMKMFGIRRPQ